jgi:uncharacterized protein (DUF1684 family)
VNLKDAVSFPPDWTKAEAEAWMRRREATSRTGPVSVVIREVIEVQYRKGAGIESDPVRIATAYYDRDGTLLAEHDPEPSA